MANVRPNPPLREFAIEARCPACAIGLRCTVYATGLSSDERASERRDLIELHRREQCKGRTPSRVAEPFAEILERHLGETA